MDKSKDGFYFIKFFLEKKKTYFLFKMFIKTPLS